jgi:hypothetical protein
MTAKQPLQGTDLISCAQANARFGVAIAAQQCGYGADTTEFVRVLQQTCQERGIDVNQLSDLLPSS